MCFGGFHGNVVKVISALVSLITYFVTRFNYMPFHLVWPRWNTYTWEIYVAFSSESENNILEIYANMISTDRFEWTPGGDSGPTLVSVSSTFLSMALSGYMRPQNNTEQVKAPKWDFPFFDCQL